LHPLLPLLALPSFPTRRSSDLHLRAPQRSEVVAIRDPADHGFSVKRIIAASGDRVYLKDGNVYVNGCRLAEPYLATGTLTFPPPDRKSTRLNSSHQIISYAVFC